MFSVAETLRRARLERGLDLATVAASTKIHCKYLQALEAGDDKNLPGAFFYKSFARQYATFLGLNAKEIDTEIDRVLDAQALPGTEDDPQAFKPSASTTFPRYRLYAVLALLLVVAYEVESKFHQGSTAVDQKADNRHLGSGAAKPRRARDPYAQEAHEAAPALVSQAPAKAAPAAPVALASTQEEPSAPEGAKVQLDLAATEETWISISTDGKQVFSGTLAPNQTKTIESDGYARLCVGNASGLEVRWNGKPLGPLGSHGQVRLLLLTPDKYQFVSQASQGE